MGAEHHDLVGCLGTFDEAQDVGALVEGMEEAVGAGDGLGDRLELLHQPLLGGAAVAAARHRAGQRDDDHEESGHTHARDAWPALPGSLVGFGDRP